MTKEELEIEAEKHADGIYHYKINVSDYGEDGIINYRYSDIKEAYIKGAEPREKRIEELEQQLSAMEKGTCDVCKVKDAEFYEKRIAELEAQIEKMKCCEMCKHKNLNWEFSPICEARNNIKIENPLTCKCEKWEIKEK